jgi:hypothetical protein
MKNNKMEQLKFEAECFEFTRTLNEYDKIYNKGKNQIKMEPVKQEFDTTTFAVTSDGSCKTAKVAPDQKTIKTILASAKKKQLQTNAIIIARFDWLRRNKLKFPENMELPNLCLKIKGGKLVHVFYSNVLTHVIKKQNYFIQILN